jgi:hypothetical protein
MRKRKNDVLRKYQGEENTDNPYREKRKRGKELLRTYLEEKKFDG